MMFYFFQGDLVNMGRNECDDMLLCFSQVLRLGLTQGGGVADYTSFELGNGPLPEDPTQYLWRTLFDLMFFIVVLVILLNVIFGIIIDQFGELRDEEVAKNTARLGACFICGIKSGTFDDHFARTQFVTNGFKVGRHPRCAARRVAQPPSVCQRNSRPAPSALVSLRP